MSMPAEDSLFEAPRAARVFLQQFLVVVCFQDKDVSGADSLKSQLCRATEICQQSNIQLWSSNQKSDWILGIVRDGERIDSDIADLKRCPCGEEAAVERRSELLFYRLLSLAVAVDWDSQF
jgi:hypothetical protein